MNATVWSCGGGTQSAAIAALIVSGVLPIPDLAVIVDTERERSATWQYYNQTLKHALAGVGCDLVRVTKSEYATVDVWGGEEGLTFLPGGYVGGGRAPQFCSNEWKTRVVQRWMRAQGVDRAELWLGISTDEMRRVRVSRIGWIEHRFPLIEQRMNRSDCVAAVIRSGWPMPPRSACWMCPNTGDREWLELKQDWPEDWARAVAFEQEMRRQQPQMTLHPSGKALQYVDLGEYQMVIGSECAGMCWI